LGVDCQRDAECRDRQQEDQQKNTQHESRITVAGERCPNRPRQEHCRRSMLTPAQARSKP
jgi:hypothetical protein